MSSDTFEGWQSVIAVAATEIIYYFVVTCLPNILQQKSDLFQVSSYLSAGCSACGRYPRSRWGWRSCPGATTAGRLRGRHGDGWCWQPWLEWLVCLLVLVFSGNGETGPLWEHWVLTSSRQNNHIIRVLQVIYFLFFSITDNVVLFRNNRYFLYLQYGCFYFSCVFTWSSHSFSL